ncbi:GTP-binding protein [Pelomyxa schiedti]|nr:GTP-binding protein [Pelomyxa schiedti]
MSRRKIVIDLVIGESIVRGLGADIVTLAALARVNRLFYSLVSPRLKQLATLHFTKDIRWLTKRPCVTMDQERARMGFKVCMIGDGPCGKSSIMERFIKDAFLERHDATVGAQFNAKNVVIGTVKVKLELWDTSGQERFRSLITMYSRASAVLLFVYDVTSLANLQKMMELYKEYRRFDPDCGVIVCGNKTDLERDSTGVPFRQGLEVAKELGADGFIEVSAKLGRNINELATALAELAYERGERRRQEREPRLAGIVAPQPTVKDNCRLM